MKHTSRYTKRYWLSQALVWAKERLGRTETGNSPQLDEFRLVMHEIDQALDDLDELRPQVHVAWECSTSNLKTGFIWFQRYEEAEKVLGRILETHGSNCRCPFCEAARKVLVAETYNKIDD